MASDRKEKDLLSIKNSSSDRIRDIEINIGCHSLPKMHLLLKGRLAYTQMKGSFFKKEDLSLK